MLVGMKLYPTPSQNIRERRVFTLVLAAPVETVLVVS